MSTIQNIPEWIQMAVNHALMKIINIVLIYVRTSHSA